MLSQKFNLPACAFVLAPALRLDQYSRVTLQFLEDIEFIAWGQCYLEAWGMWGGQTSSLVHLAEGKNRAPAKFFFQALKALVQITSHSLTTRRDSLPCLGLDAFVAGHLTVQVQGNSQLLPKLCLAASLSSLCSWAHWPQTQDPPTSQRVATLFPTPFPSGFQLKCCFLMEAFSVFPDLVRFLCETLWRPTELFLCTFYDDQYLCSFLKNIFY